MNKNYAFPGQQWTGLSIENVKIQFLGVFIKISILVLNFSTKSAKKPTIYDFSIYSLQFIPL